MDLNWLQSILYGLASGLAEILPVSAQAHRSMLLVFFGENSESPLLQLMIHLAALAALYYSCNTQILRLLRAQKLAAIPKSRRKRPLDNNSMMDIRILKMAAIPVIGAFICYLSAQKLGGNLLYVALFLVINGIIIYLPPYLPGSNKKSGTMSRADALLMGLGAGLSVLPGISAVGAATSVGMICGGERKYVLNTTLLINLAVMVGLIIFDFVAIFTTGIGGVSFGQFLCFILSAGAAFGGVYLGVKIMRLLAENVGFNGFAYYCWGAALLAVILYINF